MSTPNFFYKNRCVVVTDEDYDYGNYPELGEHVGYNRSCNMQEIIIDDNLLFHKITINCGYRRNACIDFQRKDDLDLNVCVINNILGDFDNLSYHYGFTKRGFGRFLDKEYGLRLTNYRFDKLTRGKDINTACKDILEYLEDEEAKLCNKIIDKIKLDYGYTEVTCIAVGSNGEAFYQRKEQEDPFL